MKLKKFLPALFFVLLAGTVLAQVPVANFSTTINGLEVQFTDLSTNSPTSWFWAFGDGDTSTTKNPLHEYPAAGGLYSPCLIASNAMGASALDCDTVDIVPVMGIEDASEHPDLRVYPNPASSKVHLERGTNQPYSKFELINILGETVLSGDLRSELKILNLADLNKGIYFIQFENGGDRIKRKLIIQ